MLDIEMLLHDIVLTDTSFDVGIPEPMMTPMSVPIPAVNKGTKLTTFSWQFPKDSHQLVPGEHGTPTPASLSLDCIGQTLELTLCAGDGEHNARKRKGIAVRPHHFADLPFVLKWTLDLTLSTTARQGSVPKLQVVATSIEF